ncbi:MAG: hypothetical protein KAR11_08860 [Phycisphaerae bacterium]|nr:hypothetical protein [Phycisphaerae bacterium]
MHIIKIGLLTVLLGVTLLFSASGCVDDGDGMTRYTARNQHRPGIQTVVVPIWTRGKDIYRRGIEMDLTKALVKRIELDTPYKVTKKDRADTELTGTLELVTQRTLSFNPDTGQPREMEVNFRVSFEWNDLRTGKNIVKRKSFNVAVVYLPDAPYNENFYLGSQKLMEKLAIRIVETMESDWGN